MTVLRTSLMEVDGTLVDGIILVSKNWNFLPLSVSNMSIKLPLLIRRLKKSELKCCELANSVNDLYQIPLCSYSGLDISIVIQSSEEQLPYDITLERLYESIDEILMDMRHSLTCQRMAQITGALKSSEWVDCYLFIYLPDIKAFGDALERNLNSKMFDLSPVILGKQFGQNCPAATFEAIFKSFNLQGVNEAILHLATDIYSQRRVPMWRRLCLESTFNTSPTLEYYVSGIPGLGNFYFFISTSQSRTNFSKSISGAKFYSSVGKHVHSKRHPPFSTSRISNELLQESLAQCFDFSKNVMNNLRDYNNDLNIVCNLVRNITKTSHYARCEAIVHVTSKDFGETLKVANDFFISLKLKSMLRCFCSKQFQELMRQNIAPCVQSIRCELDKWRHCNDNNIRYSMSRDEYIRVCASELILCFILRGNVISSFTKARHDNYLCRLLGLARSNYVFPFSKSAQIFQCNSSSIRQINSLVSAKVDPRFIPFFMRKLQIPGCFDYTVLVECLSTTMKIKEAAKMVFEAIMYSTCCEISKRRGVAWSINKTHDLLRVRLPNYVDVLNGFTAVNYLMTSRNVSIAWIMKECNRLADVNLLLNYWKTALAFEIEDRMIQAGTFLCVPGVDDRQCGLVIPYVEANKINFEICLRVAREGLQSLFLATPQFEERLKLIYSRSAHLLTVEMKRTMDFDKLFSVLNVSFFDVRKAQHGDEILQKILAFPFP